MIRWVDKIANRERLERLIFSKKTKRSDDLIIWSDQLIFISSHHHSILHAWTTRSRIASVYLRRFVSSISSSICWLRIESFYDHSVEMIYSNRDDLFKSTDFRDRREVKELEDEYAILMKSDRNDNEARRHLDQKKKISWRSKISILRKISMNREIRDQ
jgi:hypothetical protein